MERASLSSLLEFENLKELLRRRRLGVGSSCIFSGVREKEEDGRLPSLLLVMLLSFAVSLLTMLPLLLLLFFEDRAGGGGGGTFPLL